MRTLIIVWLGQLVCTFGTRMSSFAIRIWAWEITGQATAIALVGVSTQIPRLLITPFAGIIVDRCNRKLLLIAGDTITVLSTLAILLLYITGNLQIGHLYLTGAVNGAQATVHPRPQHGICPALWLDYYRSCPSWDSLLRYWTAWDFTN